MVTAGTGEGTRIELGASPSRSAGRPTTRWCSTTTTSPAGTPGCPARGRVGRRGPRLDQRHLPGPRPVDRADRGPPRRTGPDRQDRPGAAEVADDAPAAVRGASPTSGMVRAGQRGLRRTPGHLLLRRRRHGRARGRRGRQRRRGRDACATCSPPAGGGDPTETAAQAVSTTAGEQMRALVDARPALERHGHDPHRRCCTAATGVAIAHVGDSRGYLLRDGVLEQVTHDHTFVQTPDRRRGGSPTRTPETHPQRNLSCRPWTAGSRSSRTSGARSAELATGSCCAATGCPAWCQRATIRDAARAR